jgi:hypothetical protein
MQCPKCSYETYYKKYHCFSCGYTDIALGSAQNWSSSSSAPTMETIDAIGQVAPEPLDPSKFSSDMSWLVETALVSENNVSLQTAVQTVKDNNDN